MDDLLSFLLLLCNTPLEDGVLPLSFLRSLKCCGLDVSDMANYRPISSLSVFSKIVRKHRLMQLVRLLEANSLLPKEQPGLGSFILPSLS